MKPAFFLLPLLGLFASAATSRAVIVVYTIVNPALNVLTFTETVQGVDSLGQGSAASLIDTHTGTISADLVGGELTFLPGGSFLQSGLNPAGPFAPAGSGVDNYATTVASSLGGGVQVIRDQVFDIIGGTATHGSPTTALFKPIAGHVDYDAPAFGGAGTVPSSIIPPAANNSPLPVTLVTVGSTETLTIPIDLVFPPINAEAPTARFTGQFVLQRTIPEPTSLVLMLSGLVGIVPRRRRWSSDTRRSRTPV